MWLDGTQIMSGAAITQSPEIRFGTYDISEGDSVNGLVLLECLTYHKAFELNPSGLPGDPRVSLYFFDGPQPVTEERIRRPFSGTETYLKVDATNPNQQDEFDDNGDRTPRMMLPNGRGQTAVVVRPLSDGYVNDDGDTVLLGGADDVLPGVSEVYLWDGAAAVTPFARGNALAVPAPDSYASGNGIDGEGRYNLDGIPLTLGTGSTDYMDTATGLITTTVDGVQEDRTTASDHNPQAPEETSPVADEAPDTTPPPPPSPHPRGRLTKEARAYYRSLLKWFRVLQRIGGTPDDLERLKRELGRLKAILGEDLVPEDWSEIFEIWSEGQAALEQLARGGTDSSPHSRSRRHDRETVATNDNLTETDVEDFKQHTAMQSAQTKTERESAEASAREESWRAVAEANAWIHKARRRYRNMTAAADSAGGGTPSGSGSVSGSGSGWRPSWAPRFVGVNGTAVVVWPVGGRLGWNLNLDLDRPFGKNSGLFLDVSAAAGLDIGVSGGGHLAWDVSSPGTDVDYAGWGTAANGTIGPVTLGVTSDTSIAKWNGSGGLAEPNILGVSGGLSAGLPAGSHIDAIGGTLPILTGTDTSWWISPFGINRK